MSLTAAQQTVIDDAIAANDPLTVGFEDTLHDWIFEGDTLLGFQMEAMTLESLPIRVITKLAFRNRCDIDEQVLLETKIQEGIPDLIVIDKNMRDRDEIDLDSPLMLWTMQKFLEHGVVASQARVDALLRDGTPEEQA